MADSNNEDHQLIVEHFIHHPVVADAYAAKAPRAQCDVDRDLDLAVAADAYAAKAPQGSFQRAARMRLFAQALDGIHNALAIPARNLR